MEVTRYPSNETGKRFFVSDILNPIVINEGHFAECKYEKHENGEELIKLIPHKYDEPWVKPKYICITADSIEAVCRDFMRNFIKILQEE